MDFALPEIGEGVYEAELTAWLVKVGDVVKRGQNLLEIMTDKATMEVPAPFSGTITALRAEPGQKIKVGEVVLSYDPASDRPLRLRPSSRATRRPAPVPTERPRRAGLLNRLLVKAAPSVRQMARKLGVDLASVHGSGPEGRILIEDLAPRIHSAHEAPARGAEATGLRQAGHAHQVSGSAPQDRRTHGPGQARHPALHLRR